MKKRQKKFISALIAVTLFFSTTISVSALPPEAEAGIDAVKSLSVRNGYLRQYENLALKSQILSKNNFDITKGLTDNRRYTGTIVKDRESVFVNFENPVTANTIILREAVYKQGTKAHPLEGGAKQFSVYASLNGAEKLIYRNDKIDSYRMCAFEDETFDSLRIEFDDCRGNAKLNEIEIYNVGKAKRDFRINDYFVYSESDYAHNKQFVDYLDTLTDLTLFNGVRINDKGEVVYDKAGFEKMLSDIRAAIGGRDIKLYCTVFAGGADASFFTNNKVLAKNLVDFMVEYSIDGIDIDWEFPQTAEDYKACNQLMVDLHKEFVKCDKKLSVAAALWNMKYTPEARAAIDYFNIMVYDHVFDDYNGYHSTFKQAVKAIEDLHYRGYDMSKICLGLPYYGRNLNNSANGAYWVDYKTSGITDPWTNYSPNAAFYKDGEKVNAEAYFNGCAMIRDKTAYAISMGIGGIMTWNTMCDMPIQNNLSLHKAVKDVCEQRLER